MAHALLALLALLLLIAAATDLRARVIANSLNLAIALLAPLYWWASGLSPWELAAQLGLGLAVFAAFAGLFALGWMGGGDVKLLGALALWLPLTPMLKTIVFMSLGGGLLTLAYVIAHKNAAQDRKPEIPYGVAIAGAALCVIGEPYLNHLT